MAKERKPGYQTSPREPFTYCMFYLGQNIIWGFIALISTFLTDIGIDAVTAGAVLLIPKLWDAVNDVLFGYIVDRHKFRNGQKFIPWVKIGTSLVGVTTIAIFAIPAGLGKTAKIVWFLIAYVLFDMSYTILDTPSFALSTVMTSNIEERTSIIAGGKLWSMVGGVLATVLIPLVRSRLGWLVSAVAFVVISVAMMIPMTLTVKERQAPAASSNDDPSFREMLQYLKKNRYLIVVLIALLLFGLASVEQTMAIYLGRICLGKESAATLVSAGAAVSVIIVSAVVPALSRRWDKFYVLIVGCIFAVAMDVVSFFVGYGSTTVAIIMIMLKCTGLGFWQVIIYMLIADTVEYGTYKSGTRAAGITFSLQCFVAKLKNALIGSVVLFTLSSVGFIEGENAIQPDGVADGVWKLFNLFPAAGFVVAIVILLAFYKLRSKDVQIMAGYNNGEISREEAEALLGAKYGSPAD